MKQTIVFFLLFTTCISAQIKGKVVDENNKPIPYVNIWVENENLVMNSEANGEFSLDIKYQDKNLIFSIIGFETITIKATQAEKVVLKTVVFELETVEINKKIAYLEKEFGYYEKGGFRYHMGYFIDAVFFKSTDEKNNYPFLKNIIFRTLSDNTNAKIRIYLLERNKDGSPSEKMLSEEIYLEVKKGNRKNIIDFSKTKINLPENGFFVVFEKLKIEQNKHYIEYNFKDKNGKKTKSKGMRYEPEIPLVPVNETVGWYKRMNDKWQKSQKTTIQNPNSFENFLMKKYHDKYLVPSVNITISN